MNSTNITFLSNDQQRLVSELVGLYRGVTLDDITFFPEDPKPFLSYEATCILANELTDIRDINPEPAESTLPDSLQIKCTLTLADGRTRSGVGVVNLAETIDSKPMGTQQLYQTASSRAIRAALRTAGIDLLDLHEARKTGKTADAPPKSNFQSLIAQAHALGAEAGLITPATKAPWYAILRKRYGVEHSNQLSESLAADFVAYLQMLQPSRMAA